MKKEDLKTGMRVTIRNGDVYTVFLNTGDGDVFCRENGYNHFRGYREDLTSNDNQIEYDVMKVEEPNGSNILNATYHTIWKREKLFELSMQEIADKFQVDVNNLKIKK